MLPDKFKTSAKHYLWGLWAAGFNGGISALAGIAGVDAVGFTGASTEVRILNWKEMLSAFVGASILHGIMWQKAHPIPETFPSDTNPPIPPKS